MSSFTNSDIIKNIHVYYNNTSWNPVFDGFEDSSSFNGDIMLFSIGGQKFFFESEWHKRLRKKKEQVKKNDSFFMDNYLPGAGEVFEEIPCVRKRVKITYIPSVNDAVKILNLS